MKDEYLPKIYYHESFQVVLVVQTQTRVPANVTRNYQQNVHTILRENRPKGSKKLVGRQTDTLRSFARSGQLLLQLPHWKRRWSVAKFGALFRYLSG